MRERAITKPGTPGTIKERREPALLDPDDDDLPVRGTDPNAVYPGDPPPPVPPPASPPSPPMPQRKAAGGDSR